MKIHILRAGYCTAPEHIAIQGGAWRHIHFPAMFALLEHPRFGAMLFDTGYSYRFFDETRAFPNRLYRWMTPVTLREQDLAINQLSTFNLQPRDISHIFISHFHADHIAALADFDRARFVHLPHAYEHIRFARGLEAVSKAYLPDLLPGDFDECSASVDLSKPRALPPEYAPFTIGYDLLGDESLIAVELPGHATGQMGIFARGENDQTFFFVADAAWLKRAVVQNLPPHKIANLLFADGQAYRETLSNLHSYHLNHPNVHLVPSHCEETISALSSRSV
ncbi:MAG: MBL fold metallo-hydrolase [Chloroflexi bacterium]|nr:MBL fold metallo-hydrolase [Chloroflexota bacterium]